MAAVVLSPDFINSVKNGEEASVTIIGDSFSQKASALMNMVTNAFTVFEKSITYTDSNSKVQTHMILTAIAH